MSLILESLLDDERRAECRANDGAVAMGRPIIASQSTTHPAQRTSTLHPARSERSNSGASFFSSDREFES
jgi:hypothetical protein